MREFLNRGRACIALAACLAVSGCAGLDVEWQLNATYQTQDLLDKRARAAAARQALDGTEQARQVAADQAAAALIQARNEAATK